MEIYFEKCKVDDFELYYQLKADEENIFWTGHASAPVKENLKDWYLNQLNRTDRVMFLAKAKEYPVEAVGYLYLDIIGEENNTIETGHGVHSKFKGQGIGTKLIKFANEYAKENMPFIEKFDAWVAENNFGSINNFLKNGYIATNETKKAFFGKLDKDVTMKYFYKCK